jgi:exodeoxyribonuclease III
MGLKIIAWNVNSIRAVVKRIDFGEFLDKYNPDILCLGETKLSPGYDVSYIKKFKYKYWNTSTARKGYSGTAILSNIKPQSIIYDLPEHFNNEGRTITLKFKDFYLIHVYTPNSGRKLARLKYRTSEWDRAFEKHIKSLGKKVIVCGDMNVINYDIDIHNPKTGKRRAGFTKEERESFHKMLNKCKLIDTFRHLYPKKTGQYSYWSYFANARGKNKGWRLDYFLINEKLIKYIKNSSILMKQLGSDHAPIMLEIMDFK